MESEFFYWLEHILNEFLQSSFLNKFISVIAILLIYVILSWLIRHYTSPLKKIPGPPYSLLYGNLRELSNEEYLSSYFRWINKYGLTIRMHFWLGSPVILTADPKVFKHVLIDYESRYKKPDNYFGPTQRLLGNGLLTCSKSDHVWQRKMLNPVFKLSNIKELVVTIEEVGYKIKDLWAKEISSSSNQTAVVSINSYFGAATSDIIGKFVLNRDFGSLSNSNRSTLSENISFVLSNNYISLLRSLPFFNQIPFRNVKQFQNADKELNKMLDDSLTRKRHKQPSYNSSENGKVLDLLDLLLKVRDLRTNSKLSNDELRDQLMTFIIAGKDTVGSCFIWTMFCLAKYQLIQDRLRKEVKEKINSTPKSNTWEAISSMKFLDCVIKESLRLYPPAPAVERESIVDDVIGDYYIPKGTKLFLCLAVTHRLEKFWKDPLTFNPDRFMEEKNYDNFTFSPFGLGSSSCIGKKLALIEVKVIFTILVSAFRFEILPESEDVKLARYTVLQPDRDIFVKISPI